MSGHISEQKLWVFSAEQQRYMELALIVPPAV
jgi:hypothetical protein